MSILKQTPANGSTLRSQETRRRLIDEAKNMMAEVGIEAVSVARVAPRAGVTRRAAYYHFRTREELLQEVRKKVDRHLVKTVGGVSADEDLYSVTPRLVFNDEVLFRLRVLALLDGGPKNDVLVKALNRSLARFEREGDLQPGVNPTYMAFIDAALMISTYVVITQTKEKKRREELVKLCAQTLYQYLFFGVFAPELADKWPSPPAYIDPVNGVVNEPGLNDGCSGPESSSTRDLILRVTRSLIAEVGERAVSVSEVARRAGLTRVGVYYHFSSKEALLAAVKEKLDSELGSLAEHLFVEGKPFTFAEVIAEEDQELLYLRARQMLDNGFAKDPLISHYKKLFKWHEKKGHLREGVDADTAAIIASVTAIAALSLALSETETIEQRHQTVRSLSETYSQLMFYGVHDVNSDRWPERPS